MQATQILPVPSSPNSLRIMTMLVWFFPLFNKHSFEMYSNTAIKCNPYITSNFILYYNPVFLLCCENTSGGWRWGEEGDGVVERDWWKRTWQKQVLKLSFSTMKNKWHEVPTVTCNCFLRAKECNQILLQLLKVKEIMCLNKDNNFKSTKGNSSIEN